MEASTLSAGSTERVDDRKHYTGSHQVDVLGGRAIVRAVDLFCAFNPQFDDADNERVAYFTNARVREIVASTRARMNNGQFPQIVLRHDRPDRPHRQIDPTAIGRISSMWAEERDGVVYIVGDLDMPIDRFETYVANDSYPRRSAEFDPNTLGWMQNLSLLGREAPGRPLEDTRYSFSSQSIGFDRGLAPTAFRKSAFDGESGGTSTGAGANNFIPNVAKGKAMADEDEDKKTEHESDDKNKDGSPMSAIYEAVTGIGKKLDEHMSRCEARFSAIEGARTGDRDDDGDGDADSKHETPAASRPGRRAKRDEDKVSRSQFEAMQTRLQDQNAKLAEKVTDLEIERRRDRSERLVDAAIHEGFDFGTKRTQIVSDLSAIENDKDRGERLDFFKSFAKRLPVGAATHELEAAIGKAHSGLPPARPSRALNDLESYEATQKAKAMFAAADGKKPYDQCFNEASAAIIAGG